MLYESMLPYYDTLFVTKVDADGGAEVFFPNIDKNSDFEPWTIQSFVDGEYNCAFWSYKRKSSLENLEG